MRRKRPGERCPWAINRTFAGIWKNSAAVSSRTWPKSALERVDFTPWEILGIAIVMAVLVLIANDY